MFRFIIASLALALCATPSPLYRNLNATLSDQGSVIAKVSRSTATGTIACIPGTLICNSVGTQFAICPSWGDPVFMSVAAGTSCTNGRIQALPVGSAAPASAPSSSVSAPSSTKASASPASPTSAASSPAAPTSAAPPSSSAGASPEYHFFTGNGEPSAGWPSIDSWVSFDSLFQSNVQILSQSCTQFSAANNSPTEIADVKTAIQSVAQSTGIDPRFIFAIMMQESNGCVRAPTTSLSVKNPGLFQSHDGAGSCNSGSQGQNPCPQSEITQMVKDGVEGTSQGPGLQQLLAQTGSKDVSQYYKAARMYNSGSIAASGNLDDGIATHCYCSDIANRLLGWTTAVNVCHQKLGTA